MTATKLDLDEVRSELRIVDVINHHGIKVHRSGRKLRASVCPKCGASSSSDAIEFNPARDSWGHFGRGKSEGGDCFGDALSLVAVCAGLDIKRDFPAVLEAAAKIAGVEARQLTEEERAQRRAYRAQRDAQRAREAEIEEAKALAESRLKASARWKSLGHNTKTSTARAYLRHRGLATDALFDHDYVRSDLPGNIVVPLYSIDDSELINVVTRKNSDDEPKVIGLPGCPTSGTLCGRIADIEQGSTVIITEGVIDTLTAVTIWCGRVVLGAHGAGRLSMIVETAAPIVKARGGKLVLVPHADDVGQRCMVRAGEAALDVGFAMERDLFVIEFPPHKDLNEAHCAGWKWR